MKYTIVFTLLVLIGCGDYPKERTIKADRLVCSENTIESRSEFILTCIKNANPKSDEEPEDWIKICQEMAEKTFCQKKLVNVIQRKQCSSCSWWDEYITPISTDE